MSGHRVESYQSFTETEAHWACSCGEAGDAPTQVEAARDGMTHAREAAAIEAEAGER